MLARKRGWVEGYLTAMALESDRVNAALHKTNSKGIFAWVDNLRKLAEAFQGFVQLASIRLWLSHFVNRA